MKRSIVFYLLVLVFWPMTIKADTTAQEVSFVRCVDGDTAVFLVGEEELKFRFLAIDTPETVHPTKEVEAYGENASEYTCNKLTNASKVIVEYENSNKIDKYGRSLAWIWVDDSLLQKELVSIGYAEVAYIYGNYRYTNSLCLAQKDARENSLGLWSEGKEEGYCSTVNLDEVTDNIDPTMIGEVTPEEATKQELENTIKEVNDFTDKINDFLVDNNGKISNIFVFVFIGIAAIYATFKKTKRK